MTAESGEKKTPLQGVANYAWALFQLEETFDSFGFDLKSFLKCSFGQGLSSGDNAQILAK